MGATPNVFRSRVRDGAAQTCRRAQSVHTSIQEPPAFRDDQIRGRFAQESKCRIAIRVVAYYDRHAAQRRAKAALQCRECPFCQVASFDAMNAR